MTVERLTDSEIDELLALLLVGEIRLQGGATSEGGWSIRALSAGGLVRSDWDGPEQRVVDCAEDDARRALLAYGRGVVVRARP